MPGGSQEDQNNTLEIDGATDSRALCAHFLIPFLAAQKEVTCSSHMEWRSGPVRGSPYFSHTCYESPAFISH